MRQSKSYMGNRFMIIGPDITEVIAEPHAWTELDPSEYPWAKPTALPHRLSLFKQLMRWLWA